MRTTAIVLLGVAALVACKKKEEAAASSSAPVTVTATASTARPDFHNPADPGFAAQAPDSFRTRFTTTKGDFVLEVHRAWAPLGADRFYNLVRSGFYDGVRFFRVIPGFMAQFGIHGDTAVVAAWRERVFADDPALARLVGNLSLASTDFARLWAEHPVQLCTHGVKRYHHPRVGRIDLQFEVLHLPENDGYRLLLHHAVPGSLDDDALRLLASDTVTA